MKRIVTVIMPIVIGLLLKVGVFAQTPEKMSYQVVIRNADNKLVTDQSVGIRISILKGGINGTPVYVETHNTQTNANGLVSIEIGTGTTSNIFSSIDWAKESYFIKTETDPTGGTNYTISGVSQLLSVPYALHAKTAEKLIGVEPQPDLLYFPQSASKNGSHVLVSFSGNSNTNFSQASPIAFQFGQATPIYPSQVRYINPQKVDVEINIPWKAATGTYNIIINPNEPEPNTIEKAFLIVDWF